jgi:SAM-dependent methyltransferase
VNVAPDGSPVDLYALLPERGEGARVAQAVPPGGSILELGCGTGRITRQLVRLGYRVTAVDEEQGMLAHIEDAETICAQIERLDLGRRFDAALLASNLITAPDEQRRASTPSFSRTWPRIPAVFLALRDRSKFTGDHLR